VKLEKKGGRNIHTDGKTKKMFVEERLGGASGRGGIFKKKSPSLGDTRENRDWCRAERQKTQEGVGEGAESGLTRGLIEACEGRGRWGKGM